jgi:hypothetical protein
MTNGATPEPARQPSTRLLRKGALVEDTYVAFKHWDLSDSLAGNLSRIRKTNPIGAPNEAWLREVAITLSNRFGSGGDYLPLVYLALANYPLDKWRCCLLWHIGHTDVIFHRFVTEWLFEEFRRGTYSIRSEALAPFARTITTKRGQHLSEYGQKRAARDLLLMAADLGLLTGKVIKRFAAFHLPEEVFLYMVYAMKERESNAREMINSPEWRLFLMTPADVEREILNLHQFRKLHYETAGTLSQLSLPHRNLNEYIHHLTK